MSSSALVLVLTAAFLHALWNLQLAGAADSECATAVALLGAVAFFAPLAAIGGDVQAQALPYVAASSALELLYFALLGAAYQRAEMSVVYPLSRGLAPVLVLVVAVAVLGGRLSLFQVAGVILVALGVMLVRDVRRLGDARDLAFSFAIAITIAGYTLIDKEGLRHADPIPYLELVLATPAVVYLGAIAHVRGTPALRAAIKARTAVAALAMFGSYVLVLSALERAPAAPVAAVRESSVVIATALAATFLGEAVGSKRLTGSALVAGGVAVLALL